MKSWGEAKSEELSKIQGVCLDIDDTLSTDGKLTAEAFASLWKLKSSGYHVLPITGRPAGWCDHIARFWPVDGVVGENGAFVFFMKNGVRQKSLTKGASSSPERLNGLKKVILERFPKARWASDQSYREHDLAIDFCEDVEPWDSEEVKSLVELCRSNGAEAKVSSIHVNTWFGKYDKLSGFQNALGVLELEESLRDLNQWLFIGDSPNDEPLFEAFSFSVGVANLKKFENSLVHRPKWVTKGESGSGFSEMVETLVSLRGK